jgi:hypothetical protein
LNFLEKINKKTELYHHSWCEQQAVINELYNEETRKHFKNTGSINVSVIKGKSRSRRRRE